MFLKRVLQPERRRWQRQWFNTAVHIFRESAQLEARGVTLSPGGMSLITLSNLPVGSRVDVEFLPPRSHEAVRLSGTVRSRALYLYGIEFAADPSQPMGRETHMMA